MADHEFAISHAVIFSGSLNAPQTNGLRNQLAFLNQPPNAQWTGVTGLLLVLSSWGGSTYEARTLYGLRSLAYPIEIHVIGTVQSAAVPMMLGAERRTASPDATFLFHPWTWGADPHPGRTLDELNQFPMRLSDDVKWASDSFNSRSFLTHEKIKERKQG